MTPQPRIRVRRMAEPTLPGLSIEGFDNLVAERLIQLQDDRLRHLQRTARRRPRKLPMAVKVPQEPYDDSNRSLGAFIVVVLLLALTAVVVGLLLGHGRLP